MAVLYNKYIEANNVYRFVGTLRHILWNENVSRHICPASQRLLSPLLVYLHHHLAVCANTININPQQFISRYNKILNVNPWTEGRWPIDIQSVYNLICIYKTKLIFTKTIQLTHEHPNVWWLCRNTIGRWEVARILNKWFVLWPPSLDDNISSVAPKNLPITLELHVKRHQVCQRTTNIHIFNYSLYDGYTISFT